MSNLVERLCKYKDNRGLMANLRCVLVENKKHRAWSALNRLGIDITDENSALIAGLYATHPESSDSENLGSTCKTIEIQRGDKKSDDNKLTATERRFQHLLAAENRRELADRVLRVILMAKSLGVPVNYVQLENDLRYWGDRIKVKWASAFWIQSVKVTEQEEA